MTALNSTELIHSQLLNHFPAEHARMQCTPERLQAFRAERPAVHLAFFLFLDHTKLLSESLNLSNLSFLTWETPSTQACCNKPKR